MMESGERKRLRGMVPAGGLGCLYSAIQKNHVREESVDVSSFECALKLRKKRLQKHPPSLKPQESGRADV